MIRDIVTGGSGMLLTGITLQSGSVVSRISGNQEIVRKILHALCGVIVVATLVLTDSRLVFLTVVGLTGVMLVVTVHTQAFPVILYGDKRRDYGLVCFAAGLLVTALLWWPHKPAIVAGALTLGLADASAAVVGQRFGRHRIVASGATRSVEGTLTFGVVCFTVVTTVLLVSGAATTWTVVAPGALVATTTAMIEALVPSAIDNLLIIPWVAGLTVAGETASPAAWLAAAAFAIALVPLFRFLGWLDLPGALGTGLVAGTVAAVAGWSWLVPVAAFFALSSLLSIRSRDPRAHPGMRGLRQVTVNGVALVLLPALADAVFPHDWWYSISVAGIAAATGDTWAGEIGRHTRRNPLSLRTFTRVRAGESGAVTGLGILASVLGGLTIGLVATLTSSQHLIFIGLAAGLLGSLADSFAGAFWQARFACPRCGEVVETRRHCDGPAEHRRGLPWMDNEVVNAIANTAGMGVAALALFII